MDIGQCPICAGSYLNDRRIRANNMVVVFDLGFLSRHLRGDWGDLCQDDNTENELSLKQGFRLLSSDRVSEARTIWIIAEADRSVTTVLLPAEY